MQDQRYAGRVKRDVAIDSELHDALVPAMFLQPLVENAYAHGLSKIERDGELLIQAHRLRDKVKVSIINSGPAVQDALHNGNGVHHGNGLRNGNGHSPNGHGVGLSNVRGRVRLHNVDNCAFDIRQVDKTHVKVAIEKPQQLSHAAEESITRYGAE